MPTKASPGYWKQLLRDNAGDLIKLVRLALVCSCLVVVVVCVLGAAVLLALLDPGFSLQSFFGYLLAIVAAGGGIFAAARKWFL